uniref:Uncharacterized protein n=1 Tax=Setaria italica TaxID=4555 RepID=K3Z213_SETIT
MLSPHNITYEQKIFPEYFHFHFINSTVVSTPPSLY